MYLTLKGHCPEVCGPFFFILTNDGRIRNLRGSQLYGRKQFVRTLARMRLVVWVVSSKHWDMFAPAHTRCTHVQHRCPTYQQIWNYHKYGIIARMVEVFRVIEGISLSRIKNFEFSLYSKVRISLFCGFLCHFRKLLQYFCAQQLFPLRLIKKNNASLNNMYRNCIKTGIIAKTGSEKIYSLPFGIIAKMLKESEKSLMY